MNGLSAWLPLAQRELMRYFRQRSRVIGSMMQPILFWLFLGSGFSGSFQAPGLAGVSYLDYFYPGMLMMMMLFASIFSTITVIEDRDQGFLQGVLVAPVPRLAIVLGKVGGGSAIALIQTMILLVAAPFLGFNLSLPGFVLVAAILVLSSLGFTAMGFAIAWTMRSTAGFHAIMMMFLLPLWFLSGALFPSTGAALWLQIVMALNPVAYALTVLRGAFYTAPSQLFIDPHWLASLAVLIGWVVVTFTLSVIRVNGRERGAALI